MNGANKLEGLVLSGLSRIVYFASNARAYLSEALFKYSTLDWLLA